MPVTQKVEQKMNTAAVISSLLQHHLLATPFAAGVVAAVAVHVALQLVASNFGFEIVSVAAGLDEVAVAAVAGDGNGKHSNSWVALSRRLRILRDSDRLLAHRRAAYDGDCWHEGFASVPGCVPELA